MVVDETQAAVIKDTNPFGGFEAHRIAAAGIAASVDPLNLPKYSRIWSDISTLPLILSLATDGYYR